MLGIVVPAYNRRDNLALLLASLEGQSTRDFVVVVADDGSTDGTRELVECKAGTSAWRGLLRWLGCGRHRGVRTARARNLGVANLPGHVTGVLFLDSDLLLQQDAVGAFTELHRAHPDSVIFGPVEWLPERPHTVLEDEVGAGNLAGLRALVPEDHSGRVEGTFTGPELRHDLFTENGRGPVPIRPDWALSLNCLWPVQLFWAVGGFDEAMTGYGYEDNELGARAVAWGVSCLPAPHLWALHVWHAKPDAAMRENQLNLDFYLRRHPFNPIVAADVDWRLWFHYHADRGGRVFSCEGRLWAVNASGEHRLELPEGAWCHRLGHCDHTVPDIDPIDLKAAADHGTAVETPGTERWAPRP